VVRVRTDVANAHEALVQKAVAPPFRLRTKRSELSVRLTRSGLLSRPGNAAFGAMPENEAY